MITNRKVLIVEENKLCSSMFGCDTYLVRCDDNSQTLTILNTVSNGRGTDCCERSVGDVYSCIYCEEGRPE